MRTAPLMVLPLALALTVGTAGASTGWTPTFEYAPPEGAEKIKSKLLGWTADSTAVVWSVSYRIAGSKATHLVVIDIASGQGTIYGEGQESLLGYKLWKKGNKIVKSGALPPLEHPVLVKVADDALQLRTRTTEWTRYDVAGQGRTVAWSPDHRYIATAREGRIATLTTSPLIEARIAEIFPAGMRGALLATMSSEGAVRATAVDELVEGSVVLHGEADAELASGLVAALNDAAPTIGATGPARLVAIPGSGEFSQSLDDFCPGADDPKSKTGDVWFDADQIAEAWMRPAAEALMAAAESEAYEGDFYDGVDCPGLLDHLRRAKDLRLSLSGEAEDAEEFLAIADAMPWFLHQLPELESVTVDITGGAVIPDLSWLGPRLKVLNLYMEDLEDLGPIANLRSLTELDVGRTKATDMGPLTAIPGLVSLAVPAVSLDALRDSSVRNLTLREEGASGDIIERLGGLAPQLRGLRLYGSENLVTDRFMALVDLESLTILEGSMTSTDGLVSLSALQELHLVDVGAEDITAVGRLTGLRTLNLRNNAVADISPLESLLRLEWLDLTSNKVSDLGPLQGLKKLRHLDLEYNQIEDLTPVASLPEMYKLDLDGNLVQDLSPLASASMLEKLDLDNNPVTNAAGIEKATKLVEFYMNGTNLEAGWCEAQLKEPIPDPVKTWCF